jgi:hypothetical protein
LTAGTGQPEGGEGKALSEKAMNSTEIDKFSTGFGESLTMDYGWKSRLQKKVCPKPFFHLIYSPRYFSNNSLIQ